jgi:hypothetical protein
MKKVKKFSSPRVSPDKVAKDLRDQFPKNKLTGEDNALKIASNLAKNMTNMRPDDVNPDFFDYNDIKKGAQFWMHVKALLIKSLEE